MSHLTIEFLGASSADANIYANTLADAIRDCDGKVVVNRIKRNEDTQDYGTVLQIVLGTASVNAIAAGIGAWLRRNSGCTLALKKDGLEITNLGSHDAANVVKYLAQASSRS